MDEKFKLLAVELGKERIKFAELLKFHTASKQGGPAECFYIATSQKELVKILDLCLELKIPYFIFGGGTKILISDAGIKGVIIKNRTSSVRISGIKGKVGKFGLGVAEALVDVDSGVTLGSLNEFLKKQNLLELAILSSIYSSVGGAIFLDPILQSLSQNIIIWDRGAIVETDILNLKRGSDVVISLTLKVKSKF